MLTIIQLARAGDILSIIPAIDALRAGEPVNWLVHEHYAAILDNLSWVRKHIWQGGDSQVLQAIQHAQKFIGGDIIACQVNGNPDHAIDGVRGTGKRSQPNFILDQWNRAGMLDRFHDCPLIFDARSDSLDLDVEPTIGIALAGHSSPFRHAPAIKDWLSRLPVKLLDLTDMKMPSVVDMLPQIARCKALITIDSALLHLAYACGTPTIALSRPLEWYASEPRWHWAARLNYDEVMRDEPKRKIAELLSMSADSLLALRGSLIRPRLVVDPSRPIVQIVDWYEAKGETGRRQEFAHGTWTDARASDNRWSIATHSIGPEQRSSEELGDTRRLPYLKDVIERGMLEAADDAIVCLTNADGCLFPETPTAIRREMLGKPCICSGRIDVPRISRKMSMGELQGRAVYVGTDLFAFTPAWWRGIRDEFPDMLLACEGWDFVMMKMMERSNPGARLAYPLVYHEAHQAFWTTDLINNPGQQHNRKLGREWAVKYGYEDFLDDRWLFRSKPKNRPRVEPEIAPSEPEIVTDNSTSVATDGEFARLVDLIIMRAKPAKILETGTYHGTGTTRVVLDSLKRHGLKAEFVSIEVDPANIEIAAGNLKDEPVRLLNALSIPRQSLPSLQQIEAATVRRVDGALFVDYSAEDRAAMYQGETNFPDVEADGIGATLAKWGGAADLAILDSAGHIGKIEFDHLVRNLKTQCIIVLDDAKHLKHARTVAAAKQDRRFQIIVEHSERFGFAIMEFTPGMPRGRLLPRLRALA